MPADTYLDPYRASLALHGPSFKAMLWYNRKSQRRRFEIFTQMVYFGGKRVLDAGCGRGDLPAYLLKHRLHFDHYVGLDALAPMIDHARGRELPNCEFVVGDFVHQPELLSTGQPQIICISGSLNTMTDDHIAATLSAAWSGASEVLLFNFLPVRISDTPTPGPGTPGSSPARRLDAPSLLDWARSQTTQLAYRQDYFPNAHDATILMLKS